MQMHTGFTITLHTAQYHNGQLWPLIFQWRSSRLA